MANKDIIANFKLKGVDIANKNIGQLEDGLEKARQKIKGVEDGGNMILRPYDDHTRRRAAMYEVFAVVDNWGKQAIKEVNNLEKKINEAKTDKTRDKYNKLLDKLNEKLSKKGKYRFDYVLRKPVSLHSVVEAQDIQAEQKANKRIIKEDCP